MQEGLIGKQKQNSRSLSVHAPIQTNSALESLKVDKRRLAHTICQRCGFSCKGKAGTKIIEHVILPLRDHKGNGKVERKIRTCTLD